MTHIIEIPLPDEVQISSFDLDMLKATLHALVARTCHLSEESARLVRDLESEGWRVQVGPTWLAVCRHDRALEEATGRTLDEAISKVYEYTRQDATSGCP